MSGFQLAVTGGITAGLMAISWLGGRAYDWLLHRAEKRASDDTSWAYRDQ